MFLHSVVQMKIASYRCLIFFQLLLTLGRELSPIHCTGVTTTKNPIGVWEVSLCMYCLMKGKKNDTEKKVCCICVANGPDFWSESDLNWGIELRLVRYNNHMVGCNFDTGGGHSNIVMEH